MRSNQTSAGKLYIQQYSPKERAKHTEEQEKLILEELHEKNQGPLFKMKFWRVILDEAHTIKDPSSLSQSISAEKIMVI